MSDGRRLGKRLCWVPFVLYVSDETGTTNQFTGRIGEIKNLSVDYSRRSRFGERFLGISRIQVYANLVFINHLNQIKSKRWITECKEWDVQIDW